MTPGMSEVDRETVLIVDDDDLVLRLMTTVLQRAGLRVLYAIDATAGLVIARRERPDLLLVDVTLGRESGLALVERVRALPELSATAIMVMTGGDSVTYERAAALLGAHFLAKPVTPNELVDAVEAALEQEAPILPAA
jgi:DNA-binding response OmpR family regulator